MSDPKINEVLHRIPYVKTLGILGEENEFGLNLIMPFSQDNIGNPFLPALHGGCIGGLMEVAAVAQLIYNDRDMLLPKSIGINVDYLRRGKPVKTYASAKITKLGSRVANVRALAWQESYDEPIATLHGHCMLAKING